MVDTVTRSVAESSVRGFTRQFSGQEFVGGELAIAVVGHGALGHLRAVRGRVRGCRRHVRLLARVHFARSIKKYTSSDGLGEKRASGRWRKGAGRASVRRQGFLSYFLQAKISRGILQAPSAAALSNTNNLKKTFFILQQAIPYSVHPRLYRSHRDDRAEDGLLFLRVQRINTISHRRRTSLSDRSISMALLGQSILTLIFEAVVCL